MEGIDGRSSIKGVFYEKTTEKRSPPTLKKAENFSYGGNVSNGILAVLNGNFSTVKGRVTVKSLWDYLGKA